jgi:hypothetical protein
MQIMRGLIGFTAAALFAGHAVAAPPCYRSDEIKASLAVRFMTELMVINDACERNVYDGFIKRNFKALSAYHREAVEHFRKAGDRHAEDTLDAEVTKIANKAAFAVASVPIATFCASKAAYFATATALSGANFQAYLENLVAAHASEYPRCDERRSASK